MRQGAVTSRHHRGHRLHSAVPFPRRDAGCTVQFLSPQREVPAARCNLRFGQEVTLQSRREAVSKAPYGAPVIAGLTRNPLKDNARFSGDPARGAG
jgi:hypothetical protein